MRKQFLITAWDCMKGKPVGALVWQAKTFPDAMDLCREFGGRGEFMIIGSHGKPFTFEVIFGY